MIDQADYIRRRIETEWKGKVALSECYVDAYDEVKGFHIDAREYVDRDVWSHASLDLLKRLGIEVTEDAIREYEASNP